jgi:glycosyltransferase involved in cell wall biosynthesis
MSRTKLCYVIAARMTAEAFLREHIRVAAKEYDVHVAATGADRPWLDALGLAASAHDVHIERRIAPFADLSALIDLVRLFRRERFTVVHSLTPKAGLLAALAGRMAAVPHRVHTFTGQVWATRRGLARSALKLADRALAELCTEILIDSPSQRDFLLREGVIQRQKSEVLGWGSVCGVDLVRFHPDARVRRALREENRIEESDFLVLYLGRITRDKGVLDLARAFGMLASRRTDARLALVGPDEEGLGTAIHTALGACRDRLLRLSYTTTPERWYAAADVLCLPSYREGFGMSVIEAAACGVPAVASRIYGVVDAVEDNITGLLHPPGDIEAISTALESLASNASGRQAMGERARERVARDFSSGRVVQAQLAFYEKIIGGFRRRHRL